MCEHSWQFRGPATTDHPACKRPTLLVCARCPAQRVSRCRRGRASICGPCAESYRRKVRRVALSGSYGKGALFLTFTAPGTSPHYHRGALCACFTAQGGPVHLATWNASLGGKAGRWNRLLQDLKRSFGDLDYFKAVEVQDRGALHLHVLARARSGATLIVPASALRRLAIKHGFGHEVDVRPVGDAGAASYVAKYVSKATDQRHEVPWVDRANRRRLRAPYRTWSCSRRWGVTMGALNAAARMYGLTDGWETFDPETGVLVDHAASLAPLFIASPAPPLD